MPSRPFGIWKRFQMPGCSLPQAKNVCDKAGRDLAAVRAAVPSFIWKRCQMFTRYPGSSPRNLIYDCFFIAGRLRGFGGLLKTTDCLLSEIDRRSKCCFEPTVIDAGNVCSKEPPLHVLHRV